MRTFLKGKKVILSWIFVCITTLAHAQIIREVFERANNGEIAAINEIGMEYFIGEKVPRDYELAARWWGKAAEKGDAGAQVNLGNTLDFLKKYEEAFKWYIKAAYQNEFWACAKVGEYYLFGKGIEENNEEAKTWYSRALKIGENEHVEEFAINYMQERLALAMIYTNDSKQKAEGLTKLQMIAEKGYGRASGILASLYMTNTYVNADVEKVIYWLKKGSQNNDAFSMRELGTYYSEGVYTMNGRCLLKKDCEKAINLWTAAANKGDGYACQILGYYYYHELHNKSEASKWYKKGMELNCGPAYFEYALILYEENKMREAFNLFMEANDKIKDGHIDNYNNILGNIQNSIGLYYDAGMPPVTQDKNEARKWYELAIQNGSKAAINNLKYLDSK